MITIIIPLYNKINSIQRTIQSVLDQTFIDFEIVIINDGSTDDSVSVIASNFIDKRIRMINQQNAGVSAARNRGVMEAKGEWVVFLDADDLLLPKCLDTLVNLQIQYKTNVVSANFFRRLPNSIEQTWVRNGCKGIVKNNLRSYYMGDFSLRMGCAMFCRECLVNNIFPEHLSRYEDMSWILNICKSNAIAVTTESVLIYTCEYRGLSKFLHSKFELDYTYHLDFKKKSFWEKLIYAKLIISNLYSGVPFREYFHKYGLNLIIYIPIVFTHSKIKKIAQLCR